MEFSKSGPSYRCLRMKEWFDFHPCSFRNRVFVFFTVDLPIRFFPICPLTFFVALLPDTSANTRMPGRMFWEDPQEVVRAMSPMWHFDGLADL